jgi:UDP-N-acetylglucosamine 2-epimerase (non-hydrolysing)
MKITCVLGTRPEAIKLFPLIERLRRTAGVQCTVVASAQHRELVDEIVPILGLAPDIDLDVMVPGQGLNVLLGRLLQGMDAVLQQVQPDLVISQGDTTTAMAAGMAAFQRRIDFAHVEAGLRSGSMSAPFPEEMNRVVMSRLATLHFAPTMTAQSALLTEGIPAEQIFVTGNTGIDALMTMAKRTNTSPVAIEAGQKLVLVTLHRRENCGAGLVATCEAIRQIVAQDPRVVIVWPLHPNPEVRAAARRELEGTPRVRLVEALPYPELVAVLKMAHLVLTDSGGLQEESPALGKPVLVLRDVTERPEAVDAGVAKLVGCHTDAIVREVMRLMRDRRAYEDMSRGASPYGDGRASERIVTALIEPAQFVPFAASELARKGAA